MNDKEEKVEDGVKKCSCGKYHYEPEHLMQFPGDDYEPGYWADENDNKPPLEERDFISSIGKCEVCKDSLHFEDGGRLSVEVKAQLYDAAQKFKQDHANYLRYLKDEVELTLQKLLNNNTFKFVCYDGDWVMQKPGGLRVSVDIDELTKKELIEDDKHKE